MLAGIPSDEKKIPSDETKIPSDETKILSDETTTPPLRGIKIPHKEEKSG